MKSNLPIVISGYARKPNCNNLKPFWSGFINIQKIQTEKKLVFYCHTWNPELKDLINSVYRPKALKTELQPNYTLKYFNLKTLGFFEENFKRVKSPWKNISFQSIFGYAESKEKSIMLLINDNKFSSYENIISTRWDLGCTGSKEVNTLIYDDSLPEKYIYLPYYRGIEEGYADMWFVIPKIRLNAFRSLKSLFEKSLFGKNNYLDAFTNKGWFISDNRRWTQEFLFKLRERFDGSFIGNFLNNKIFISQENKFLVTSKRIFPRYQALNIHALVKYFFYVNKLRKITRFLDINDFSKKTYIQDTLINPLNLTIVIIGNKKEFKSNNFKLLFKKIIYIKDLKSISCLKQILDKNSSDQFVFIKSSYFLNKINLGYLNAASHYLNNSTEFCINLKHPNRKEVLHQDLFTDFPGMIRNFGGNSLDFNSLLVKRYEFICFLKKVGNINTKEFSSLTSQLNLIFLSIDIFKYDRS
jgi:hypothetical protein